MNLLSRFVNLFTFLTKFNPAAANRLLADSRGNERKKEKANVKILTTKTKVNTKISCLFISLGRRNTTKAMAAVGGVVMESVQQQKLIIRL